MSTDITIGSSCWQYLLAVVYALEVLVREGDGWHPRPECHRVHLVYCPEVFLPGVVCASSPGEAAGYSVDNLSVTPPIGLPGGIVSSRGVGPDGLSVASVISVISAALRRPRSPGWIRPAGWVSAIPDEATEMPILDKFLDLILKGLTLVD